MVLFQSKPNVPDSEKARLEFHLQQIADGISIQRLKLPVIDAQHFFSRPFSEQEIVDRVCTHLEHDGSSIGYQFVPKELEKCGGGG
jgi:hypothetical protein